MTADWPALAAGDFALPAGVCAEAAQEMPRSASAAFAVQVGRALLLFTQFGVGGEGGAPVPARSADGWREDLLAALHRTFPVYGDPAAS